MRAERFAERTAANVATARTSVPAPVTSDEIVGQSVARKGIDAQFATAPIAVRDRSSRG
jgi:hypothetical protein